MKHSGTLNRRGIVCASWASEGNDMAADWDRASRATARSTASSLDSVIGWIQAGAAQTWPWPLENMPSGCARGEQPREGALHAERARGSLAPAPPPPATGSHEGPRVGEHPTSPARRRDARTAWCRCRSLVP